MQIRKLRNLTEDIHSDFYQLAVSSLSEDIFSPSGFEYARIQSKISNLLSYIHKHSIKQTATPADLATPSFRTFLWLRFMDNPSNMQDHFTALEEYLRIIRKGKHTKNLNFKQFILKIDFSGYLYRQKTSREKVVLQINEAFINAPIEFKEAIIAAAFAKRRTKHINTVRSYASSAEFQHMNKLICGEAIKNINTCRGKKYDLSILFQLLNKEYFNEELQQPRLVWTKRSSKRRLGYYHQEIHTIAVNNKLDDKKIPRLLLEYVLYHEMLHQYYGIQNHNGRRYAHTSAFKKAEKEFKHQQEAENIIKLLQ